MALLPPVAYLRLEFKDDYLVAAPVLFGRGQHPRPFDEWLADSDVSAVADEQHFIQLYLAALGRFQPLDVYRLAFDYLVLFSACFNYRVNIRPPDLIFYQFYS